MEGIAGKVGLAIDVEKEGESEKKFFF